MARAEPGQFEARRRKERVAFLVVKFLRMYLVFREIAAEFHARSADGGIALSGLFTKVAALTQGMAFELKELAHTLFRTTNGHERPQQVPDARARLAGLKGAVERRFLDSSIGTGFHLLLILQESLYQIQRYTPELDQEKKDIAGVLELTGVSDPRLRPEQRADLEALQALDKVSEKLAVDAAELAEVVMRRCEGLLEATARVIRRFATSANDNEILVLNLLRNTDLVEKVYGEGSTEVILAELCARKGFRGGTGTERALAFVRSRCGNISALGPAAASSRAASRTSRAEGKK